MQYKNKIHNLAFISLPSIIIIDIYAIQIIRKNYNFLMMKKA